MGITNVKRSVGRPVGIRKTGGRQKGIPNRDRSVLAELTDIGKHPVDEIMALMDRMTNDKKMDVWLKLLSYCYPTMRSVEVSGDINSRVIATVDNMAELCRVAREVTTNDTIDADLGQLPESDDT